MSATQDPHAAASHGAGKQGDFLLTPKEAACFLRLSESFLAKARMRGDGPRYRKLSRAVRYSKSDLEAWLRACARTSTAE